MQKNKFTTYLLYAIGEIVLVVIGILIAVQIDTWNKQEINNKRTEVALKFLVNELKEDSVQINSLLGPHLLRRNKSKQLLERASSEDATLDTLLHVMTNEFDGYWDKHFTYNKTAYENMLTGGVFELLADSLKIKISDLYHAYERNTNHMQEQNKQYRNPMNNFFSKYPVFQFYPHEDFKTSFNEEIATEFHPLAEWLLFVHYYMWDSYIGHLEEEEEKVNMLLTALRSYQQNR